VLAAIVMAYLADLALRLAAGAGRLPEAVRARHAAYLADAQNADGGFSARRGPSDLYYTGFALRALAMLGELDEPKAARAAGFLGQRLGQPMPSIDFLSLVTAAVLVEAATGADVFAEAGRDRRESLVGFMEEYRRGDGSYAKTPRGAEGSTYHTFLVAACKQIVGAPLEDEAAQMVELVRSRRRPDGGYVEIGAMRHSGTNPTAAAVGLLQVLGALTEPTRTGAAAFLADMQNEEGGLRANTRIPVADLLSTFTGLVALSGMDAVAMIDTAAARRFVESLEQPGGGFRGGSFDHAPDVEYTCYGLGTLALLAVPDG
jgi:geranylgeranyl transferase type-2 subunit beta